MNSLVMVGISLASFAVGLAFAKLFAIWQGRKYLEKLHDNLNTMRWIGADEGWDNAITAVRKEIQGIIKLTVIEEDML